MPWTSRDVEWFSARLSIAVHETNREYRRMARKRRLIESAFVDGALRAAGYLFDDDGTPGPHRSIQPSGASFQYFPQFVEVDDATVPFQVAA